MSKEIARLMPEHVALVAAAYSYAFYVQNGNDRDANSDGAERTAYRMVDTFSDSLHAVGWSASDRHLAHRYAEKYMRRSMAMVLGLSRSEMLSVLYTFARMSCFYHDELSPASAALDRLIAHVFIHGYDGKCFTWRDDEFAQQ